MIFVKIRIFPVLILTTFTSSFDFNPHLEINLISADHTIRDPTHPTKCLKSHKFKNVRLVECPTELSTEYFWKVGGDQVNLIKSEHSSDGLSYCWSATPGKFKTLLRMAVCNETEVQQQFEFYNGVVTHAGQDIGDLSCFLSDVKVKSGNLRFEKCKVDPNAIVTCDPGTKVIKDAAQWQQEKGYWIGEYSLYGSDGQPSTSSDWNYPYSHYKGFITDNVLGNTHRQRNVFMYPPQTPEICTFPNSTGKVDGSSPVGLGSCGVNGNTKVLWTDQSATTCSNNLELKGDIEKPYGSLSYTNTELVGKENSLLYQVWLTKSALNYYEAVGLGNPYGRCFDGFCGYEEDRLMQSQLTTLTQVSDGSWRRTTTAQGFDDFANLGAPSYASFYRERKVNESEFWSEFEKTRIEFNILESDMCAWKSGDTGGAAQSSGYITSIDPCRDHLSSSFEVFF